MNIGIVVSDCNEGSGGEPDAEASQIPADGIPHVITEAMDG